MSDGGAPHEHAMRLHDEVAERHLAAAARLEELGESDWADVERRCAALDVTWLT